MKTNRIITIVLGAMLLVGAASSCVRDLDVTPIDPNTVLPEDVLSNQDAFTSLLAKCYQGLGSSSSYGPDGDPDIDGVDGGYGQYLRALINMNDLTTDVCTCAWNDGNLFDIHNICWNSSNEFVLAMYYRIFFQISQCNEFIRRSNATTIEGYNLKEQYIAEARALRLLSWYHAIDMFGNVPFSDENSSVGSTGGPQKSREDLFKWMVGEAEDILNNSKLAEPGKNEYGRCDKGMVQMILAKLYLNAEVWAGQAMYAECATICEKIISEYELHDKYSELFCADNHLCSSNTTYNGDELIFVSPQDGINLRSYGSTNFLVFGFAWKVDGNEEKTMDMSLLGISSPWSGYSLTGAFTSKFSSKDARAMFFKGGYNQYIDEIRSSSGASEGWKSMKYTNINHDGSAASAAGFVDTDFPIFRVADAYLMYAECAARGASGADKAKGQEYLNKVSNRAGAGDLALNLGNIIDERGRELYLEGFRRQDLIRFGLFTSADYLWEFKGGEQAGKEVDSHFALFPITAGDINANSNLKQNPGY